jgi:hypothetical protein
VPQCLSIPFDSSTPYADQPRGSFKQAVFATAGIAEVLPSEFGLCLTMGYNAEAASTKNDYYTVKFTSTNTALTNYQYSAPNGNPIVPAAGSLVADTVYFWFGQDYRNQFTLTIFIKPSAAGALEIDLTSANAGANINTILQDDPAGASDS